jgi:hypothetical protein
MAGIFNPNHGGAILILVPDARRGAMFSRPRRDEIKPGLQVVFVRNPFYSNGLRFIFRRGRRGGSFLSDGDGPPPPCNALMGEQTPL